MIVYIKITAFSRQILSQIHYRLVQIKANAQFIKVKNGRKNNLPVE